MKIIKKGVNNFWHWLNNDTKKISVSDFEVVLDSVDNTFVIVFKNGANIPQIALSVNDIEVIDETDASIVETYPTVELLRDRLIQLNYTPYLSGGGSETPNLQQVTDIGNTTDNGIESTNLTGNAKLNISNGNYSEYTFRSEDISIDNFGITEIRANPEEGILITKQGSGNSSTITVSDSVIALSSNDGVDLNNVTFLPNILRSEKTIRTDEHINFSGLGDLSSNATTLQNWDLPDESGTIALITDIPTKTSDLINDGDNGITHFISLEDLPSNIIFYPTNVASDISGYVKIVTSITDPSYNTTAVDISTGAITTTDQLISSLATSPNIIVGNPGVFNITTIGNIRRISGTGEASFYFKVYKRTSAGVETLIATSDNTIPVIDGGIYIEFTATAIWNDGIFLDTDRVVMKYYANRIAGGSNPTYQFQFGGVTPVRSLVPIPLTVVPMLPIDAVPTDGSTNAVSSNGVFDALAIKEDTTNKVTTFTGNETSTTKFPVVKAIIDYFTSSRIATILGFTPANDASVVHLAGTETITGAKTFSVDTVINGHNVGRGGANGATNVVVGATVGNNTGLNNTHLGGVAGNLNSLGNRNTYVGYASGLNQTTGNNSVFVGERAGRYIADGTTSNTIANNSIFLGQGTKPLANNQTNQIVIGYDSTGLGSNTTTIGNSSTTLTAIYGNVAIGGTSVNASAILQADSTTKGFLPPRMTNAQRIAIASPAIGLIVYCTDTVAGLYVYKSTGWTFII